MTFFFSWELWHLSNIFFSVYEQVQTLHSCSIIHPSRSLWMFPTHTKGSKHWASVWYCTTPHHTLTFPKGEKQQQLSGKGTVLLPSKKINQQREGTESLNRIFTVCFLLAEMRHRCVQGLDKTLAYKGRKINRTFAKNIFVFVPLTTICQSWSRWHIKENYTTIVKMSLWYTKLTYCITREVITANLLWPCLWGNEEAFLLIKTGN